MNAWNLTGAQAKLKQQKIEGSIPASRFARYIGTISVLITPNSQAADVDTGEGVQIANLEDLEQFAIAANAADQDLIDKLVLMASTKNDINAPTLPCIIRRALMLKSEEEAEMEIDVYVTHILLDMEGNENAATIFKRLFGWEDVEEKDGALVTSTTMDGILAATTISESDAPADDQGDVVWVDENLYLHQKLAVQFLKEREKTPLFHLSWVHVPYRGDPPPGWVGGDLYFDRFTHVTQAGKPIDSFGAAVCIPMGLGKTRVVIELIAQDLEKNPKHMTLIVVPRTLVEQTVAEFAAVVPDLHVTTYATHTEDKDKDLFKDYYVIFSSYKYLFFDSKKRNIKLQTLAGHMWKRLVVDEFQCVIPRLVYFICVQCVPLE
jgi:hypothetical protein